MRTRNPLLVASIGLLVFGATAVLSPTAVGDPFLGQGVAPDCAAPVCSDDVADMTLAAGENAAYANGDYSGLQLRTLPAPQVVGSGAFAQAAELVGASGEVVAVVTVVTAPGSTAAEPVTVDPGNVRGRTTFSGSRVADSNMVFPMLELADGALRARAVRWGDWDGPVQMQLAVIPIIAIDDSMTVTAQEADFVAIPEEYVYDPQLGPLNDYCTVSPDSYVNGSREADFRGPCAHHDLCYASVSAADQRRDVCNPIFQDRLKTNCSYATRGDGSYGRAVFTGGCFATVWAYRTAVDAWTWV